MGLGGYGIGLGSEPIWGGNIIVSNTVNVANSGPSIPMTGLEIDVTPGTGSNLTVDSVGLSVVGFYAPIQGEGITVFANSPGSWGYGVVVGGVKSTGSLFRAQNGASCAIGLDAVARHIQHIGYSGSRGPARHLPRRRQFEHRGRYPGRSRQTAWIFCQGNAVNIIGSLSGETNPILNLENPSHSPVMTFYTPAGTGANAAATGVGINKNLQHQPVDQCGGHGECFGRGLCGV